MWTNSDQLNDQNVEDVPTWLSSSLPALQSGAVALRELPPALRPPRGALALRLLPPTLRLPNGAFALTVLPQPPRRLPLRGALAPVLLPAAGRLALRARVLGFLGGGGCRMSTRLIG